MTGIKLDTTENHLSFYWGLPKNAILMFGYETLM